jgi:hypothetical protein
MLKYTDDLSTYMYLKFGLNIVTDDTLNIHKMQKIAKDKDQIINNLTIKKNI